MEVGPQAEPVFDALLDHIGTDEDRGQLARPVRHKNGAITRLACAFLVQPPDRRGAIGFGHRDRQAEEHRILVENRQPAGIAGQDAAFGAGQRTRHTTPRVLRRQRRDLAAHHELDLPRARRQDDAVLGTLQANRLALDPRFIHSQPGRQGKSPPTPGRNRNTVPNLDAPRVRVETKFDFVSDRSLGFTRQGPSMQDRGGK